MSDSRKTALVTGAGSGIGRAVSIGLLREGFEVFLVGRREEALSETAGLASDAPGRAFVHPADVTDPQSVGDLFGQVSDQSGRLDLLFNNAGKFPKSQPTDEVDIGDWNDAVAVNLTGAFLMAQGAFRLMKAQSPRGGRIINNGSVSAHVPRPNAIAYTATKHAITGMTRSLALDGRAHDIACSQIDIGNAATDLIVQIGEAAKARGETEIEPTIDLKEVVDAVLYIARLPLSANVLFMTLMATKMPFVGRG